MFLVFDVGATYVKYAWMSEEGEIQEKGKVRTRNRPGETLEDFLVSLTEIYDTYKETGEIEGIAIGLPGQIDVENGIVYGGGGISYLHEVPLQKLLSERCGNLNVSLENDGKCAALAEIWKGNAKDCQDALVLVFGTGIGGGVIKDRKVHHGNRLIAGEVSFVLEKMEREDLAKLESLEILSMEDAYDKIPFTWTARAAASRICHRVARGKNLPVEEVTGEKIYAWAREGDEVAINVLEDAYFSIAKQCCNLYTVLDPDIILIGGGISAEPAFIQGIKKYVDELKKLTHIYSGLKIDVCKFRNDSNLLGALYNYKQKYGLL